ncbi:hypothetical protein BN12_3720003 [Nostocoides japonicum T1-X7]|uniref:Uncharacterized protein n=1 Tax=Nostocoides japonicum T1-X7 TaxID=1194083 RepID=A0A077LZ39_9MICO|nr:hypothetical protein BN12_3720003 [Tetrasphaera japonica T1-X7]
MPSPASTSPPAIWHPIGARAPHPNPPPLAGWHPIGAKGTTSRQLGIHGTGPGRRRG